MGHLPNSLRLLWFCPLLALGCAAALRGDDGAGAATQPAAEAEAPDWSAIAKVVGADGTLKGRVYTIEMPRTDLDVNIDGLDVPSDVLLSTFHFYKCPHCSRLVVSGEFCVLDFEANDVMSALRAGGLTVAGVAPMFIGDRPHLLLVRFHGEAFGLEIAKPIKAALDWTGPARTAPRPAAAGKEVSPQMNTDGHR
jgi:hypothetical protein